MTSQSSTPAATVPTYLLTPSTAPDGDFDFCSILAAFATLKWSGVVVIILTVLNILGNSSLIAAIVGNRHLWVRPNMLMANLCLTNILYFLGWSLQYVEFQLHPCWQFGVVVCKLTHACKYITLASYGFFMIVMTFERYCAITNRFQSPRASVLVIITWFLAFIICLPVLIFAHVPAEVGCFHVPPRQPSGQAYITSVFIITYAFPSLISVSLFIVMAKILFAGTPQTTGGQYPGTREFQARRRMALVVLALVAFFTTSMFTFHVYELSYHFATLSYWWHYDFFKQFHHVSAYANYCLCPWIVYATSKTHRDAIYMLLLCKIRAHPKLYNGPEGGENQPVDPDSPDSVFTEIPSSEPAETDVL
ncbi:probable C-C chemokine receptor type 3 [Amphiura filiformis]|uniref:probable C-C chemokine receptor type 3 n=1 Tax=Amphiura filiformis TaxID=82378 RepID=UPI003B2282D0